MKPFLLVNSGSGGGKAQAAILEVAVARGVAHHVTQPGDDFTTILASAVADGADVLAAAGGDGTLSTTADFAMLHDLPMIVVPAGTRNHFALDLGLDLDDPAGVLTACLPGGHERRVDVGRVNKSLFLNNVSLGIYPAAVSSDDYRRHKAKALIQAASEAVSTDRGGSATLTLQLPETALVGPQTPTGVVLVSNNAYAPTFAPGSRIRPRLDAGEVWVYVGGGVADKESRLAAVEHAVHAVFSQELLRAAFGTTRFAVNADRPDIPIAVDGEVRSDLTAPFVFASEPGGLRVLVPADPSAEAVSITLEW